MHALLPLSLCVIGAGLPLRTGKMGDSPHPLPRIDLIVKNTDNVVGDTI